MHLFPRTLKPARQHTTPLMLLAGAALGPEVSGLRYAFHCNDGANHCLFQRTYGEDGRHDYVLGARTPGPNVFLDGYTIPGGTFSPHPLVRSLGFATTFPAKT
jgi:hypothetical protein